MSDDTNTPQFTVNEMFNAESAEIAFRSSDNIVFKIHSRNLEVNTAGLSPAALTTAVSEVVPLSEDSATLELLFQYIYPCRQPLLDGIEFALLASLAEAAEKYEVFAAMTVCYIRMSSAKHEHPTEIMQYSARHDYMPLLYDVAPLMIRIPLLNVLPILPPHFIMPWLNYYDEWRKVHAVAFLKELSHDGDIKRQSNSGKTVWTEPCTHWPHLWQGIASRLGAGVQTLAAIDSILKTPTKAGGLLGSLKSLNGCCTAAIDEWRTSIREDIQKIPSFSKFIN